MRPEARASRPHRLPWVAVDPAPAGLAISSYLAIVHHTTHVGPAWSDRGSIDCQKVTTSPQSMIGTLRSPTSGWSSSPSLPCWSGRGPWSRRRGLVWLLVAWVTAGVCMVLRLLYADLFQLDAICLGCSAVHVLTVCLFATVLIGDALAAEDARGQAVAGGMT